MNGLVTEKVIFLFALLGAAWVGTLPACFKGFGSSERLTSVANAFSAGVFVSVALLHIIPEAMEGFEVENTALVLITEDVGGIPYNRTEEVTYNTPRSSFSFVSLAVIFGYITVLLIEKVAFANFHAFVHGHGHGGGEHGHAHGHAHGANYKPSLAIEPRSHSLSYSQSEYTGGVGGGHQEPLLDPNANGDPDVIDASELDLEKEVNGVLSRRQSMFVVAQQPEVGGNSLTPYLLLLALGVHSVFEGIALGLTTDASAATALFLAIVSHKVLESFGLASAFSKASASRKRTFGMCAFFSLLSPTGVGIGLLLEGEGVSPAATSILMGLTSGMFLYVALTEGLPEEFDKPRDKWLKFAALVSGIGLMSVLFAFIREE